MVLHYSAQYLAIAFKIFFSHQAFRIEGDIESVLSKLQMIAKTGIES